MFLNWYFILKNPCKPITVCSVDSINISCAAQTDCNLGNIRGYCDQENFRCINLVFEGNKHECEDFGGEWKEIGC